MTIKLQTVAPASEPATVAEAKLWIRSDDDGSDHDGLLTKLIRTARTRIEKDTGQLIGTQTWLCGIAYWPRTPYVLLPTAPVQSITSVQYTLSDGLHTLPTDDYEIGQATNQYPRLLLTDGKAWPTQPLKLPGMNITYVCGFATPPDELVEAIKALVTYWYDNPEAAIASTVYKAEVSILPLRYQELIKPFTLWRH